MRAAPESFAQVFIAQELANAGARVMLEASVLALAKDSSEVRPVPITRSGRIDIAVYYDSLAPRLFIEVKKLSSAKSLNKDHERIVELLACCSKSQHGVMIGYTTGVKLSTVTSLLQAVAFETGTKVVRTLSPIEVRTKMNTKRFLGAAVYRVDPN